MSVVPAKGYVIGVAVPIPFGGVLKDRIAVGMAGYTPTDVLVAREHLLYPETPQYPLLADRSQVLAVRLGAGADIGWGIRVGAGLGVLAALQGNIAVATVAGTVARTSTPAPRHLRAHLRRVVRPAVGPRTRTGRLGGASGPRGEARSTHRSR